MIPDHQTMDPRIMVPQSVSLRILCRNLFILRVAVRPVRLVNLSFVRNVRHVIVLDIIVKFNNVIDLQIF